MEAMQLEPGRDAPQQAQAFAKQLHDSWGVGRKACNDGVLLLLSVKDRQARTPGCCQNECAVKSRATKVFMGSN